MTKLERFLENRTKVVVILGESGVGKTSIVHRFIEDSFLSGTKSTIGNDFKSKYILVDGIDINLQIWDTGGQEFKKSLVSGYCRGANCCILVYDVTSAQSFVRLNHWKEEFLFNANLSKNDDFPFIVIGNKIDENSRCVSEKDALDWCRRNNNIPYFETSAKRNINVHEAFGYVPTIIMEKMGVDDKRASVSSNTSIIRKMGVDDKCMSVTPSTVNSRKKRRKLLKFFCWGCC